MRSAREELDRRHAEYANAAGALVTSGVFGTSTVEIYDGGYVRVAAGLSNATQPERTTKKTPYEKLRSIKFTQSGQDNTAGMSSALEGAVGPAMARLAKGGAGLMKASSGLMKASAPGLAVAGLAHLAGAEGRKSFLTIATDKRSTLSLTRAATLASLPRATKVITTKPAANSSLRPRYRGEAPD